MLNGNAHLKSPVSLSHMLLKKIHNEFSSFQKDSMMLRKIN